MKHDTDAPLCLRRARGEMLLALEANNREDEVLHRRHADELIVQAVRSLHDEPEKARDWSELNLAAEY